MQDEKPKTPIPTPSRKCPECKGWIRGKGVVLNGREYCSSDCAIDEYERRGRK